jgi:autoinducer-2 kinase
MKAQKYFLVIDLGTGSGRAAVYDNHGNELGFESREWHHAEDPRYPGSVDFDTETNWQYLCDCIKGAIKKTRLKPTQISSVSATGMRLGTVCYDKGGEVLFACTNTDTRADKQTVELIEQGLAPKIYEIDGEWPGIGGPLVQLLWLRENEPEKFERIAHVTMLTDWVLYKLSGEYSVDPSCAGTSGMFDGQNRTWSEEIARWLNIPTSFLAPVNEAGTIVGQITPKTASETGLKEGIPVVQGGSDAGCGLLGRSVINPGEAALGGGSFWNASIITDNMLLDPQARAKILPHIIPGLWQLEGVCFYAGYMVRWFRDAFCQEEMRLAKKLGIDAYKILDEQASQVPAGAYGVQVSVAGVLDAKRWVVPPPTFIGWSIDNPDRSSKAVFYRALLENAAFQIRGTFELLNEISGINVESTPILGGASRSSLWPQIVADVLGKPILVPVVKEASSLGAAMCAAYGIGIYKDINEAAEQMVAWERVNYPSSNHATREIYREKYIQWRKIYQQLLQIVDLGIVEPMWKAAGVWMGDNGKND